MSSILIKNMEMPINCIYEENGKTKFCFFCNHDDTPFCVYRGAGLGLDDERPDWCPLVEVPTPHGRLIDADALDYKLDSSDRDIYVRGVLEEEAPTIIEAEGENK